MGGLFCFITWNIDPWLIPNFEYVRWYGLMWALGMLAGYQMLQKIYKHDGKSIEDLDRLTLYTALGAVIGARLGHILFYDPIYYWSHPIEVLPIRLDPYFEFTGLAGLASHGGVIGTFIALYLYTKKYDQPMVWILDRLTIAAALLGGFIRLGNLMNSEIIGIPTTVPWAFVFTRVDQLPRHPAQLYEALFYIIIFVILYQLWRSASLREYNGLLFGIGITLIFLQRFVVEFVKENQVGFEDGMLLNMGQWLSIPMIIVGAAVIIWSLRQKGVPNGKYETNPDH